jgi:putative transposase
LALWRQLAHSDALGKKRYAAFVAQGRGIRLWDEALKGQIYLGDERFLARAQSENKGTGNTREIPRAQRRGGKSLTLVQYLQDTRGRDEGIFRAYREGGYTQTAIAEALELSVSRISRVIKAQEAKGKT